MIATVPRSAINRQYRVSLIQRKPLNPSDYCLKWVQKSPEEYGYRRACIEELHRVTGLSPGSIERWGKTLDDCPDHVKHTLRKQDILNQISLLLRSLDEIEE